MHQDIITEISNQSTKVAVPIVIGLSLVSIFTKAIYYSIMLTSPSEDLIRWTQFISALIAIIIGGTTLCSWIIRWYKKQ